MQGMLLKKVLPYTNSAEVIPSYRYKVGEWTKLKVEEGPTGPLA